MPMVLLPPPWFSTTTGCFNRSERRWPMTRASKSAPPPGAYGTTMWIGLSGYSAEGQGAKEARPRARAAMTPATNLFFMVVLVCVGGMSMPVRMVVVVHQFLRHVGEELARGRRRGTGPFDAAALAGGLEEVVPREAGRVACNLEALG